MSLSPFGLDRDEGASGVNLCAEKSRL